jgi:hemolysin activation/secretion protein
MEWGSGAAARLRVRGVAVLAWTLLLTAPAWAQDGAQVRWPGQTPQDIDPARRSPPVQGTTLDPVAVADAVQCPFAGQGTVTLFRIDLEGATLIAQEALQGEVADLLGHPADTAILCTARDRIAARYARDRETLVRVEIPEQTMSAGALTLRITEGRLQDTRVENAAALGRSARLAAAYLVQARSERATHWADVERAFVLTREIPGAEPHFSLQRAADGSVDGLVATATFAPRRTFDFTLGLQNLGSEESGRAGASLRVDANSFTRFGERSSLVLSSSDAEEQKVAQWLEEVRIGAGGWSVLSDVAYAQSRPKGGVEVLELDGHSTVARIGARNAFVRRRTASVDYGVRLEAIDQHNDLGFLRRFGLGVIPLVDERLRVLALDASGRWQPREGRAFNMIFGAELRQGLRALGASSAGDPLLSREQAQPAFSTLRATVSARWAPSSRERIAPYLQVGGVLQWTDDALPAYEEFQFGNYTVGRGFDPGAAAGDRAIAAQLETGATWSARWAALSAYAYADAGHLWNLDDGGYAASPWSLGGGVRLHWRAGQLNLLYAAPRTAAVPGGRTPDARVLVTFSPTYSRR